MICTPFENGFQAAVDGLPYLANPHLPDTFYHREWANGWAEGKEWAPVSQSVIETTLNTNNEIIEKGTCL
jgi:hypothetical protein